MSNDREIPRGEDNGASAPRHQANEDYKRLAANIRDGDPAALECLVELEWLRAWRKAYGLFGDRHAAEDFAQEHALRVVRSQKAWIMSPVPWSYINSILINAIRTRMTKLKRLRMERTGLLGPGDDDGVGKAPQIEAPEGDGPVHGLETRELCEEVGRALDRLPPDDRDVLILQSMEDLNYEEIAEVLKISVAAVTSRLHRARVRLREALGPAFLGDDGTTNR
jgi:RNA polymerase sigma-70 factor (ECF subfamily)